MRSSESEREAQEAARARDIEQAQGRAGNARASEETSPPAGNPDLVGGSGQVPRTEVAEAAAPDRMGSPGAEADQQAARKNE